MQQVGVKVYMRNVVAPKKNNMKFADAQQAQVNYIVFSHLKMLLNCNKYDVKYINESIKTRQICEQILLVQTNTNTKLCKKNKKMAWHEILLTELT
jgi:hypothetical protein